MNKGTPSTPLARCNTKTSSCRVNLGIWFACYVSEVQTAEPKNNTSSNMPRLPHEAKI